MFKETLGVNVKPILKSLKDWDAKVGDIFVFHAGNSHLPSGVPVTIVSYNGKKYYTKEAYNGTTVSLTDLPYWSLVERTKEVIAEQTAETKPDGGPAQQELEASKQQNSWNRSGDTGAVSQFKGVSRKRDKWRARIVVDGVKHYLGVFGTEIAAGLAYKQASRLLQGEYSID